MDKPLKRYLIGVRANNNYPLSENNIFPNMDGYYGNDGLLNHTVKYRSRARLYRKNQALGIIDSLVYDDSYKLYNNETLYLIKVSKEYAEKWNKKNTIRILDAQLPSESGNLDHGELLFNECHCIDDMPLCDDGADDATL